MKFLLVLFLGLFISLSASAAIVGNVGASSKGFSFQNGAAVGGGFDKSEFTHELYASTGTGANLTTTFRFASGTAYSFLAAPSKSILIGVSCSCGSIASTSEFLRLNVGVGLRTNEAAAGLDQDAFGNFSIGSNVFSHNPATILGTLGVCVQSRRLNLDLTAAHMPARFYLSMNNGGSNGMFCTAYIKEE